MVGTVVVCTVVVDATTVGPTVEETVLTNLYHHRLSTLLHRLCNVLVVVMALETTTLVTTTMAVMVMMAMAMVMKMMIMRWKVKFLKHRDKPHGMVLVLVQVEKVAQMERAVQVAATRVGTAR